MLTCFTYFRGHLISQKWKIHISRDFQLMPRFGKTIALKGNTFHKKLPNADPYSRILSFIAIFNRTITIQNLQHVRSRQSRTSYCITQARLPKIALITK